MRIKVVSNDTKGCNNYRGIPVDISNHPYIRLQDEISVTRLPPNEQPRVYKWPPLSAEDELQLIQTYCF